MRLTKELCEAEIEVVKIKLEILKCEKLIWELYLLVLEDNNDILPEHLALACEEFMTVEEIQKKLIEAEANSCLHESLLKDLMEGKMILYNYLQDSYKVLEQNKTFFM